MNPSSRCLDIVKDFESFRPWPYPDPGSALYRATPQLRNKWGFQAPEALLATLAAHVRALSGAPWTNGYGETRGVSQDTPAIREPEAYAALVRRVAEFAKEVAEDIGGAPTSQGQFDAMVSLAYNIGLGWKGAVRPKGAKDGFRQSSVLRNHIAGLYQAAARSFGLWNKSNGKVMAGLTRRRAAEGALYLTGMADDESNLASGVEPERPLRQSEIVRASTAAGATATVAAAAEVTRGVADIKDSIGSLGDWIVPILLLAVVGLCVYIYLQRKKQKDEGWA